MAVVTSDRAGSLASDGGAIFRRMGENAEGVAIAMAAQAIHVPLGQRFAVGGSWGAFEGENALSVGGAFRFSDNLQVDAGIGFGVSNNTLGGPRRRRLQLVAGQRRPAPLGMGCRPARQPVAAPVAARLSPRMSRRD